MRIERRFTHVAENSSAKDAYEGLELTSKQIGHAFAGWSHGVLQATARMPVPKPVSKHDDLPWLKPSFSLIVGVAHVEAMVSWWVARGWESGFFDTEADARSFYDECRYALAAGMMFADKAHWQAASVQQIEHAQWHVDIKNMQIVATQDSTKYRRVLARGGSGRHCPVLWLNMRALEHFPEDERPRYVAHVVKLAVIALEISVHHAALPHAEQARQSFTFRPLGLGVMAHNKGGNASHYVRSLVHAMAYGVSADLAESLGAYPAYSKDKARVSSAMKGWRDDAQTIKGNKLSADALKQLHECWEKADVLGEHAGYRHSQILQADVPPLGIKVKAFSPKLTAVQAA